MNGHLLGSVKTSLVQNTVSKAKKDKKKGERKQDVGGCKVYRGLDHIWQQIGVGTEEEE